MGRIQPIEIGRKRDREPAGLRLLNLGPKSSSWLEQIGIRTREDIEKLGVIEVGRRSRAAGFPFRC